MCQDKIDTKFEGKFKNYDTENIQTQKRNSNNGEKEKKSTCHLIRMKYDLLVTDWVISASVANVWTIANHDDKRLICFGKLKRNEHKEKSCGKKKKNS